MLSALGAWLSAFAFTQACEVPLYLRATAGGWRVALLASALTHPAVWFVFPGLLQAGLGYWAMAAWAEAFAVGVEAWWLRRHGVPHALVWSLLANACSVTLGSVSRVAFGVP